MVPKKKGLVLVSAVLLFAVVWFGASLLNGSPSGEYEGRILVAGEGGAHCRCKCSHKSCR